MRSEAVGASGTNRGAIALVSLDMVVEETKLVEEIPCYVLLYEKTIWTGDSVKAEHNSTTQIFQYATLGKKLCSRKKSVTFLHALFLVKEEANG